MRIALVHWRSLVAAAVASALIAAGGAGGATRAPADRYQACLDKATTTVAMLDCNDAEYRRVSAELKRVYAQLFKKLTPARRKLLAKAEQRWLAFRTSECAFSASVASGGTLEPVIYGGCLIDLTGKRIKDLRVYLKQPA